MLLLLCFLMQKELPLDQCPTPPCLQASSKEEQAVPSAEISDCFHAHGDMHSPENVLAPAFPSWDVLSAVNSLHREGWDWPGGVCAAGGGFPISHLHSEGGDRFPPCTALIPCGKLGCLNPERKPSQYFNCCC